MINSIVSLGTKDNRTYKDNNYIIDGNFQVAQVTTLATEITNPAAGTYPVFDLWKTAGDGNGGTLPTIKHSQQLITSGSVPNSKYCYRINVNGAGTSLGASSYYQVYQNIEHGTQNLCGLNKKVTISFYARTSIIGTKRLGVGIYQSYGTGGSPSSVEIINGSNVTLSATWTKYKVTITTNTLASKVFGTNNDDSLILYFWSAWGSSLQSYVGATTPETFVGSGDIEIAQVKVEPGEVASQFMPLPLAEELRKCQRYHYYPLRTQFDVSMISSTTGALQGGFSFPSIMRIIPTIIIKATTASAAGTIRKTSTGAIITPTLLNQDSYNTSTHGISSVIDWSGTPFIKGDGYDFVIFADARF